MRDNRSVLRFPFDDLVLGWSMLATKELADLPPELIKELGIKNSDRMDLFIYNFIKENGATTINQILIHIYREMGIVMKRKHLVGRIYRLIQKSDLGNVEGKKGVYQVKQSGDDLQNN